MASSDFTPVPSTRATGSGNPAGDMDQTALELAASGAGYNVLNTTYGGGADPTGATDSTAAFQAAINALPSGGGTVIVPPGSYVCNTGALAPVSGLRLFGFGRGSTAVSVTANSLINAGASATDTVEIAGLTLQATGHDLITGANVKRWNIHDCVLTQNSAGNAIWNAPSVSLMVECVFARNEENVSGATRTIEAWFLSAPNNSQQINANCWRDNVVFNNGADASKYWYHIQATGGTTVNSSNRLENITFEHPYGGMIWFESAINTVIDQCLAWDTTNTIANSLIYLSKNSGGQACSCNSIRDSGRNGSNTLGTNISDIQLDANCTQTTIVNPRGNSGVFIDVGNSAKVSLVGLPATYTLRNTTSVTYADSYLNVV